MIGVIQGYKYKKNRDNVVFDQYQLAILGSSVTFGYNSKEHNHVHTR